MKSKLKSKIMMAIFLSLTMVFPAQSANRVVVHGDFEAMGLEPYNAVANGYTGIIPTPGYGWQTTDGNGIIEVWNNFQANAWMDAFTGYGGSGYFVETNGDTPGFLYQPVCLRNGESIEAKFAHRARRYAGENVQYAIYKDFGETLAFKFGDYSATGPEVWDYHVTGSQVYRGESGIFNLGFKSLDEGSMGNLLDSVEILLRPVIDLGAAAVIEEAGGGQLMLPLRVNGTIPAGSTVTVFIKDTGTIPRDLYRIDPPRFGTKYGFNSGQQVLVTYDENRKGWFVTLPQGPYDGNTPDNYVYLPIMLKDTWDGTGSINFNITAPGNDGSSTANLWTRDNPVCEGDSFTQVEFKQSDAVKQWYSDASNTYTTEKIESDTISLSTHYNVMNRTGDVRATYLTNDAGAVGADAQLKWSAASKLDARDWRTRNIYTTKDKESTASNIRVLPLEWGTLSQAEQTDFYGEEKYLDYVKGDKSSEMQNKNTYPGGYTNRFSLLGEVHSNVVMHKGVVYAQTGEGMLHAFDQETGEELWAYLPKALLRLTNISERQPTVFENDDIAPLMTGKIALVKVGDEMVLLGNTGGLERSDPTQSRLPVFYGITVETAAGSVPTTPLVKWTNYGRCNDSLNTSIPYCGVEPITQDWKVGYLSKGVNQVVAFMPTGTADAEHLGKRHALQIFSVATGEAKTLYTAYDVSETGRMTDIDFSYEKDALATYPTEKGIKEVYAGDTAGYIWRVSLSGLAFEEIQQISEPEFKSVPTFEASFRGHDSRPISVVRVSQQEGSRGGVSGAPVGRMIVFGTGNAGVRKLNTPIPDNGQHVIAAYFDAATLVATAVNYNNLIPQIRKQDPKGDLFTDNQDINYSDENLGWKMALTNPVSDVNEKEQIFASPFLLSQSVLVYSGVPVTSNFAMTNFVAGYFMQMNIQTGKIEIPAEGSVYTPHLDEGVFAQPTRIFNEETKNTHFNIKYASQEPYTESKVNATQAFNLNPPSCTPSPTTVCGAKHKLIRLSVSELFAS